MNNLEWARYYLSKGFSIIPIAPRSKYPDGEVLPAEIDENGKPVIDAKTGKEKHTWKPYQIERASDEELQIWFGNGSERNIGIVTGSISGIAVVDLDSSEAVEFAKKNNFPQTPLAKTGKGYHVYCKYKEGVRNFQKRDDLPGIDLRGDGGYVVAPPSIHKSGRPYQWFEGKGLEDFPFADLPEIILAKRAENKTPIKELYHGVPDGCRNDSLTRLVGSWVNDDLSVEECIEMAYQWNDRNNPPENDLKKIERTVRSIYEKHHRGESGQGVNEVIEVIALDKKIIQVIPFPFHIFPEKIKRFIYKVSESFSIQPELTASLILSIISGTVGNTMRVSVKPGYEVILFLWLMIIGRSGYGKSPVMNYLMGPILSRQAKDSAHYEEALQAYMRELRKTKEPPGMDITEKKPKAIHKIVADITIEALADVFKGDQRGVIGHHDELASFMLGMDQYRAKGNDLQHYLTLFNGKPWKIDRKSGSSFIHNTGLALIGGIQSEILPRIFESTTIKNGLFPRFLTLNIEERPSKFDRNGIKAEVLNYWDDLISQCYKIPLDHDEEGFVKPQLLTLCDSAIDIWINFHDEFASIIPYISDRLNPFCEKLKGYYSIKFIGLLHVLDCIDRGVSINENINPDTVRDAVELTRYFAGQALLTLNLYDEAGRLTEFQVKLIKTLHSLRGEVEKGRLLFKRIDEAFNADLPEVLIHKTERLAGLLKELGLKTEKGGHNIVYLVWEDDRIKNLFSRITITTITTITSNTIEDTKKVIDKSQNKIPQNDKQDSSGISGKVFKVSSLEVVK